MAYHVFEKNEAALEKSYFLFLLIVLTLLFPYASESIGADQVTVEVTEPMPPPDWAVLERQLLDTSSYAVEEFAASYVDDRGYLQHSLRWGILDGPDDTFDTYANWTLLYSLGGRQTVLDLFKKAHDGAIKQYTEYKTVDTPIAKNGSYYKEFIVMSDWHHTGEGMRAFHLQGLADPFDIIFQKRTKRYAGFYMNEDPEAPNYDPKHKIIKSIWNGSRGPLMRRATPVDWVGDPVEGTFNILHSDPDKMMDFEKEYPTMLAHCYEYLHSTGDHPLNLLATNLVMNAYALTHESKYRDWLVEYVNAWAERTNKNGGNIPSNIGLDGSIGGETDGKWYGGTYGWDFAPWSPEYKKVGYRNMVFKGMWPGFTNALLVTGDQKYVDVLRRQIDNIYAQKKIVNGREMFPTHFGEKGEKDSPPDFETINGELFSREKKLTKPKWYHYTANRHINKLIDIYLMSMERKDLERIPIEGWIAFLEGKNPNYPKKSLLKEFEVIRQKMEAMRNDPTTADTRLPDWPLKMNPYSPTLTLNRLMTGSHLHGMIYTYNSRLRYFDPVKLRTGLPEDIAALVTGMDKEKTTVTLVNLNQIKYRDLIVQTGGYGEHQCIKVKAEDKVYEIDNRFFKVRMDPGSGTKLVVYHNRYVNRPTLALPWHGDIPH